MELRGIEKEIRNLDEEELKGIEYNCVVLSEIHRSWVEMSGIKWSWEELRKFSGIGIECE